MAPLYSSRFIREFYNDQRGGGGHGVISTIFDSKKKKSMNRRKSSEVICIGTREDFLRTVDLGAGHSDGCCVNFLFSLKIDNRQYKRDHRREHIRSF